MKPLIWLGTSLHNVRSFPPEARGDIGYQLYKVQIGLEPSDWRPTPSVGTGVQEVRVHSRNEYRVIYIAKFSDAVYVLHAFVKRTPKTAKGDVELARQRLCTLVRERNES